MRLRFEINYSNGLLDIKRSVSKLNPIVVDYNEIGLEWLAVSEISACILNIVRRKRDKVRKRRATRLQLCEKTRVCVCVCVIICTRSLSVDLGRRKTFIMANYLVVLANSDTSNSFRIIFNIFILMYLHLIIFLASD